MDELIQTPELKNLPLSSNQWRLWIISQQDRSNPAYNLQLTYHIPTTIDYNTLNKSIGLLFERQHTMFSVFRQKHGIPYIDIVRREVNIELIDFSDNEPANGKEKILEFAGIDSRKPFDIENGPLYRIYLLKENEKSYYFHATIHHLIFDGWSRRLFVQELSAIYNALILNQQVSLAPVKLYSYDFAAQEINTVDKDEEDKLAEFWKEYLMGCPSELKLPLDHQKRAFSSGMGCRESFEFPEKCSVKLKAIASEEGVSTFNVVVSLLGVLLNKYSGETDVCIGVPVSTRRKYTSSDKTFGLFVNTMVLRLLIDNNYTFKDYLKGSGESLKKSLSNSGLSFDKIVEAVRPERIPGINPMFQVSLSYMNDMTIPMQFGKTLCERVTLHEGVAPFDISLYMWEDAGIIKGDIEYNTDIFNSKTIERLRDSFIHLANSIAENPARKISDFSIITEADKKQLSEFNKTDVVVPECLVHDLFEERVLLNPEKTAVTYNGESLTYKDLSERSNRLANYIVSLGIESGDTIGISLERTLDMVVSVLAVLKAGCTYLPMDPSFPDDRLDYMFEDSGAKMLITEQSLKDKFRDLSAIRILVDSDRDKISRSQGKAPDLNITNQYIAYIIYTSGSTGKPKGVKVHHQAVVNFLKSMYKVPGINESDRLLAVTTLSFDISVLEVFLPLTSGAEVVVAGYDEVIDGKRLIDLLTRYDVTMLQATPATWNLILGEGWTGKPDLKALCGGEAIPSSLVKELLPRVNSLWNMYGPTETTVWSTCYNITDPDAPIIVGRPIDNTTIYILDKDKKILPVGVVGEVCIGGLGVTKGYHNRPELNDEKFIKFEGEEIIYRTGDQGRFLEDGNIELLGRIDNQIKLRGFRIEPGEIEVLLSGLPYVKEAVVKVHKFDDGDERLVAFLNTEKEFDLTREKIFIALSQNLPAYMIPSFYQISEEFPRLPNGKINKKLLSYEGKESEVDHVLDISTLNQTQKSLFNIWESVIKTAPGSLNAGFFDIGGNSLLGIRLLNSISETFGVKVDFREMVANSAFDQMCNLIDNKLGTGEKQLQLSHLTRMKNLPLTANQKRLWMISQMQPDIPSYIIRLTYRFSGSLDIEMFEKSIDLLFKRHYTVFSVVKEENGEPYFEILPREIKISYKDFSGLSQEDRITEAEQIITGESVKQFILDQGPLYRIYLLKEAANEYIFHVSIHHIIFDGWSQGVFAKDLSEIYNSLINKRECNLDELRFQQFDYAEAEKNRSVSPDSVSFWKEYLAGCSPVLNFPFDYPRSGKPTGKGSTEQIQLTEKLTEKLRQLSKDEGVSLFSVLLTAFGLHLSKYSGEQDLNIGLPVAHRPHSGLENVFGMFVNTVVVRLKYDDNVTFKDLIGRAHESALNSIAHQDVTFDLILDSLNPERVPNANPLFQVAFAWQDNLNLPLNLKDVKSEVIRFKDRPSIFDITLYLWEKDGVVEGEIEYNKDLLTYETIFRFKEHFITLLSSISSGVEVPASSIPLITEGEVKMINEVNSTEKAFTNDKTIIQLFERQAEKSPENVAIEFDGRKMTYHELNERAGKLAAELLTHDIKSGDFVGLLLKRSPDLVVTLLALFKIGVAYVPLNLTDPEQRIFSIMDTANIKYIIANSDNSLVMQGKYSRLNLEQLISDSENKQFSKEEIKLSSSDSAYIIFTSGTTGTPKGVWVNHKAAVNLIEWVNETFRISAGDKLLWATNLSFDLSVYDIFGILIAGATVRILSDDDRLDPQKQYEILLSENITFWDSAPQALNQISRYFTAPGSDSYERKLRLVFLSGDWIPLSLPPAITSAFPSAQVVGLGGATEATVWSNFFLIGDINPSWKSIPYGKPIQNSRYYVLDEKLNHCWVQKPGDLYIGGECVALGYYNDKNLTDKKFIPDPFNPGSKLYFTGDKAQWMPDGNIEFLGREDDQLKVRGYRVELGEIKNAVLLNKKVKDAAIVPDKSDRHDIKVILFVTVHEGEALELKDLRKELRSSLPEYMMPSEILKVEKFPMTSNGKLDSKALLATFYKMRSEEGAGQTIENLDEILSQMTKSQLSVYSIWSEALATKNILPEDDFFDIGGNSLLGIRLINKIKEVTGVMLTFRELISNSTLIKLAALIESKTEESHESIDLVHLTDTTNLPLTLNQKRLWLISKLQPDVPSYITSFTYRLKGSIDRNVLDRSLNLLLQRHHILFTVIREKDGDPYCEIAAREADTYFLDVSDLTEIQKKERVNEIFLTDQQTAFDLEKGPLFRFYLLKTGDDEYYFRVSIHHIVFDGWSQGVLINDLNEIYNSILAHKDPILDEIKFQQYDYAQWENSIDVLKDKAESIEFWKENLNGCSPVLNFPYDFKNIDDQSGRAKFEEVTMPKALSEKIKLISRDSDASLFTTMLSIYGILMSRYSNDDDINIGVPVAFRPHTKLENILGMFVNTVVMRLKYDKGVTFRELIHTTNEVAMNAIAHQDIPFENVVEIVNPERSSAKNPLFQASFAWQNNLTKQLNFEGARSEKLKDKDGTAIFDIILYMWEADDHIEGEFEYSTDLLKRDTVVRLKNNLIKLAENLVDNPDASIESLSIISGEERKIIDEINNTRTDYPRNSSVIKLFEEQVLAYSEKTALGFRGESLTYRELNEKANQLAGTLITAGVCANTPVGIMVDKSIEMIVGILAIMKAGGAYLPIDPEYPLQRIDLIIEDSGCKILLTQNRYADYKHEGVSVISLDDISSYSSMRTNPGRESSPDDMAYIMYTSGTTGTPKGSIIINQSIVRLVRNTNYLDFTPDHRILLTGAIAFDATTFEIWGTLLNGGTLFMAEKETILDPNELGRVLKENKITTLWLTSSLFTQIAEIRTDIFSGLKYLLTGGDVISANHINRVRRNNPELTVINCYGPTENTTFSTTYRIEKEFESNIPIGKPISNSTAYIFDSCMNLQPIGVKGELYVGGDGLSKGYLNRDDLNTTKFVYHPQMPGERLYRTGDFARWLDDGNIDFLGRMDNQLKIRGFRVELEGIETALQCLDDVIEAVVKPVKIAEGDTRLAAFLNVSSTFILDDKEIVQILKKKLPQYMIPDAFKVMHEFPKTINGKIDKKALVIDISELTGKETEKEETRTLTPTQSMLITMWREILKTGNIISTDDFFDVGGNSLLSIKVLNSIKEKTGVGLTFKEFLANSTIFQLGDYIDRQNKGNSIQLVHLTALENLPLTNSQKQIWMEAMMDPDAPSYIVPYTFKLSGKLNRDILKQSFEKLFERQKMFFSVIKDKAGEPYCNIVASDVNVRFSDFSNLSEPDKQARVKEILKSDSLLPFDLENGPLYRIYLARTNADEHILHLSFHHIIFDGWSWSVFVNELEEIYKSLMHGTEISLPEPEFQEYDYAYWQNSVAGKENEKKSVSFWKDYLDGCSTVLNFPYDFQRKEKPANRSGLEEIVLSPELTEQLKQISKTEGTSLFTTLLAIFGVQMHKYCGDDDLNIGLWVANRPHSQLENIVGMFVNTIVARLKYSREQSIRDVVHYTNETTLDAISHQDLSFDKVVDIVNPERTSGVNPLFQVVFAWQDNLGVPFRLEGIESEQLVTDERTVAFDLTLSLLERDGSIQGVLEYNTDLIKKSTAVRMRNTFIHLIESYVSNPSLGIAELSVVSEEDKKQLAEFNNTEVAIPECLVHNLFEEQAALNPDKIAVIAGESGITYSELNGRANQLASHLLSLGVKPGDAVGLSLERSVEMIVSVLGILKSGCCYLPMDPSFPDDRLIYMFEDSGARILVTQSSLKDKFAHLSGGSMVLVDSEKEKISSNAKDNPGVAAGNQSLAYLIYTSGSTGRPKGVKVHHQAVVNFLLSMTQSPGLTKTDRLLAVTTLSFDISVLEVFLPLSNGAQLIVALAEHIVDGQMLGQILDKHDITVMQATPATWNLMIAEGWQGKKDMKALCGGEAIAPTLVKELLPRVESLWDMYGPTETTVWSTCYQITDPEAPIVVGKPIKNTTIHILDKGNSELPAGVIGEVGIGGLGVTKGYHNRPDLTEEKFIQLDGKGIVYKTGDQGRYLDDGNIELLGRVDNQIKLRGFRIEPGEIETLLAAIPNIREAVVKVHKFGAGDERLVAFMNAAPEYDHSNEKVTGLLSKNLPPYMIPSFYQISDGFPRLPNGKINKKALEFDIKQRKSEVKVDIDSLSEVQKKLMSIWQNILKTETVNPYESFFNAGGNSMLAISLAKIISEEFETPVKALVIFEHPTIMSQSDYISGNRDGNMSEKSLKVAEKIKNQKNVSFKRIRK